MRLLPARDSGAHFQEGTRLERVGVVLNSTTSRAKLLHLGARKVEPERDKLFISEYSVSCHYVSGVAGLH